jgi:hypothetical protein
VAQLVNGIIGLFDPNDPTASPSPSASGAASPAPRAAAALPIATKSPVTRPTVAPCPSASASVKPSSAVKRLQAAAGQPNVAAKPSRMTGTSITMTNLMYQGVVELTTADGPITVLKFTMDSSVTVDFRLHTYARGNAPDIDFITDKLTVRQNVVFYTSRFQAKLLGVPVDYTPTPANEPLKVLLPLIYFTDPDIQLVWVDSDVLTAEPSLLTKVV